MKGKESKTNDAEGCSHDVISYNYYYPFGFYVFVDNMNLFQVFMQSSHHHLYTALFPSCAFVHNHLFFATVFTAQ